MITNPKIERKKSDIAKTETRLAEVKAKLREQKQDLIDLENEEIVAMFRKEVITEDDLKALMRSRQEVYDGEDGSQNMETSDNPAGVRKGESTNALN